MNLNEMTQLNPPVIVQDVNHEAKLEAEKWDKLAQEGEKNRCRSMLSYSAALYNLEKDEGYKLLGFDTLYSYVYDRFGRSRASTIQTISVYKKYVIDLGVDMETLVEIGIGKLSMMSAHVNEDNIDDTLEEMKSLSQKEITSAIKEKEGLAPNQTREEDTVEGVKQSSLKYKGPEEMVMVVKTATSIAADSLAKVSQYYSVGSDIPPLAALEYVCASFMSGCDLENRPYADLETALNSLERVYKIKISYQDAEESE